MLCAPVVSSFFYGDLMKGRELIGKLLSCFSMRTQLRQVTLGDRYQLNGIFFSISVAKDSYLAFFLSLFHSKGVLLLFGSNFSLPQMITLSRATTAMMCLSTVWATLSSGPFPLCRIQDTCKYQYQSIATSSPEQSL